MARIPTYEIDPVIHDLDMLLGTDYDNQDHTKNFFKWINLKFMKLITIYWHQV